LPQQISFLLKSQLRRRSEKIEDNEKRLLKKTKIEEELTILWLKPQLDVGLSHNAVQLALIEIRTYNIAVDKH
jgi:hypothetical protein